MTSVQIKDVPEETHRVLRRRAAEAHQSLQEYLRARLVEEASRPTVGEILSQAAAEAHETVTFDDVTDLLRIDRDRR